jgi:hypothetical protein
MATPTHLSEEHQSGFRRFGRSDSRQRRGNLPQADQLLRGRCRVPIDAPVELADASSDSVRSDIVTFLLVELDRRGNGLVGRLTPRVYRGGLEVLKGVDGGRYDGSVWSAAQTLPEIEAHT